MPRKRLQLSLPAVQLLCEKITSLLCWGCQSHTWQDVICTHTHPEGCTSHQPNGKTSHQRITEEDLVERRINAAGLCQPRDKDAERILLPPWERERASLLSSASLLPHTHAQGISSRSHQHEQYGYSHFYFLLFLLYTPFCPTRLKG